MKVGEVTEGQVVWVLGTRRAVIDTVNPNGSVWLVADNGEYSGLWAPQWLSPVHDPRFDPFDER